MSPPLLSDRLIDLLGALEDYGVASTSARGEMDGLGSPSLSAGRASFTSTMPDGPNMSSSGRSSLGGFPGFPFPFPGSLSDSSNGMGGLVPATAFFNQLIQLSPFSQALDLSPFLSREGGMAASQEDGSTREALKFILSPQGIFFREFVLDEVVKSIDALSREQFLLLVQQLGLQSVMLPVLLPGESFVGRLIVRIHVGAVLWFAWSIDHFGQDLNQRMPNIVCMANPGSAT